MADDSTTRKATPIYSGVMKYFPDALAAVARLSKAGNDKHNPGEPLHWSRGKSNDHLDCAARHMIDFDAIDPETGELHGTAAAWRMLAQLQLSEEKRLGKAKAPVKMKRWGHLCIRCRNQWRSLEEVSACQTDGLLSRGREIS